jgi:hypothetical protein
MALSAKISNRRSTFCSTISLLKKQDWDIYIDQSKTSLDRGGGATLDAFCGLTPSSSANIIPAVLPKSNKKGPWVRCISNVPRCNSLDISSVDSVDKVYRVLTKHLKIKAS